MFQNLLQQELGFFPVYCVEIVRVLVWFLVAFCKNIALLWTTHQRTVFFCSKGVLL